MKKLWIFGDSFSDSCGLHTNHPYCNFLETNLNYTNNLDFAWQRLLAKELGLELMENGISGAGNMEILNEVILNMNKFHTDDYVIIGWTLPTRLSLPSPTEYYRKMVSLPNVNQAKYLDNEFGIDSYFNFYTNVFLDSIDRYIDYSTKIAMELSHNISKNYNLITWAWADKSMKIDTIANHTNFLVVDDHPSISGHEYILDRIKQIEWGSVYDLYELSNSHKFGNEFNH